MSFIGSGIGYRRVLKVMLENVMTLELICSAVCVMAIPHHLLALNC
jgi:hypothetical protein